MGPGGVQTLQQLNRFYRIDPEREAFRFGDGNCLYSKHRMIFEAFFTGHLVLLALSVVEGSCPPLFSRHGCTSVGMKIDTAFHSVEVKRLGVNGYKVTQSPQGHDLLTINDFWGLPEFRVLRECNIKPTVERRRSLLTPECWTSPQGCTPAP